MVGRTFLLIVCIFSLFISVGCTKPLYYWGHYENSLVQRYQDTSEEGQLAAFGILQQTVYEAESKNGRLAPGIYADYGYLLFKRGYPNKAIEFFKKEAALYPEAKYFMDSLISRIQDKGGV